MSSPILDELWLEVCKHNTHALILQGTQCIVYYYNDDTSGRSTCFGQKQYQNGESALVCTNVAIGFGALGILLYVGNFEICTPHSMFWRSKTERS